MQHTSTLDRFLIVWFGQLLSSIGSGLTAFALSIYVFQLTGSASSYALILFVAFVPALILKPLGGALADRLDRRLLMIVGDAGSVLGLVFIIAMLSLGIKDLWIIYVGVVISSIFVAIQNPAYKASVTDMVQTEHYSEASGLMQLAESARYLISPVIAGVLLQFMDIDNVLMIDVLTFLIAIVTVFWVKVSMIATKEVKEDSNFIKDVISGFNYTFGHKGILCLLCIMSLVTFFIGLLQALLGPMMLVFVSPQAFGTSLTIATTGMLVSSLLIGIFGKSKNNLLVLSIGLSIAGLFFALMGIAANIYLITTVCFLFFLNLPFVNTSLDVLIRRNVANEMQGRVWSIVSLISQLGMAIAFGIGGYLADKIFNPLLLPGGTLAASVGTVIGVGPGRGIGLMFIISGVAVVIIALVISKLQALKELDLQVATTGAGAPVGTEALATSI